MKNNQKGFVVPLIIAIAALLAVWGGVYYYQNRKVETPLVINSNLPEQTGQTSTTTANCVLEGRQYGAGDSCCSGLVRQPSSPSGTWGLCVKLVSQNTETPIAESDLTNSTTTTTEKATGIIKSVATNMTTGQNYIVIDYVTMNPNWYPGGNSGPAYTNLNTQTRSLEVGRNAKIILAGNKEITFNEFINFFTPTVYNGVVQNQYQALDPWNIEITNNIVTKITEHYLP